MYVRIYRYMYESIRKATFLPAQSCKPYCQRLLYHMCIYVYLYIYTYTHEIHRRGTKSFSIESEAILPTSSQSHVYTHICTYIHTRNSSQRDHFFLHRVGSHISNFMFITCVYMYIYIYTHMTSSERDHFFLHGI